MIGQTVDHYRILSEIGAGGMGVVYRAHDEVLQREVALKLLRSEIANEPGSRMRILREARAAASLNHPHICTVYQVGEFNGKTYIAMEYVEGRSLAALVVSDGLPLELITRYAKQIADALAHAHARGIVHRDLKPSNVVITPQGHAKVLDFGLAKRMLEDAGEETLSRASAVQGDEMAGTLPYMAPEILRGEPADARSDIWSFGVLLYNLATGELPFKGRTGFEISTSILRESPESTAIKNTGLRAVILRCLAKEPSLRYQEASEVKAATEVLTATAAVTPGSPRRRQGRKIIDSIAVLPFENETGDPETEYLSEGITETIINSLAQLPQLRVVPRSSVFHYKQRQMDARRIGQELNVRVILLGRVLSVGDRLTVHAELIDIVKDSHLWGGHFKKPRSDVFEVQEEIANEISEKLRLQLSAEDRNRLGKRYTRNTEAYYLYLQARYFWNQRTPGAIQRAILHFEQAIAIDPTYALAYVGLADCYTVLGTFSLIPMRDALPRAKAAAAKGLEIDRTLGEAHASLAIVLFAYERQWPEAEDQFRKSIRLHPNYATAHQWYSFCLVAMGRIPEAIAEVRRAVELDPLSLIINTNSGTVLYWARQFDLAIEQYRKTIRIAPDFWTAHWMLGLAYEQKNRYEDAVAEFRRAIELFPGSSLLLSASLARSYALSGARDQVNELLEQMNKQSAQDCSSPFHIAMIYAALEENDAAFAWLQRACEEHEIWINFLKVDPRIDQLREDPRYNRLLKTVGVPK
jgi:eukaryotic-like serine/threonine-protein kinase